ncbi:putative DNA-directed RNA polymerase subunit Rpb9/RpoM [Tetraselmis virus 1]|uniref:Putative DNA-directed RNA polymerase subunit Rpb9/RpoM n=1 Tax=Tetraselmis virus 1 TaxID=2060617 RepID=A0A2P0VN65_9VIRU|nr:putative DNA-directed RNA polymerase subunit Rpb9/RpoM [Tetraselmis virus 1]AUF82338.1 putative DNA-directed RNA polymerase subunit Rpb9/RpoM [Tetraselmis virus 1]
MKFCEVCDNLLYVKLGDSGNKLMYQCNYCSSSFDPSPDDTLVSETNYRDDRAKYDHLLTPLVHEDPTLPRVDGIACPNKECTRPARKRGSVLYIKYDPVNLKFLYSCTYCKHFWGPDELGVSYNPENTTSSDASS